MGVLSACLGYPPQGPDVKGLQHRREINKKTRSGDKKLAKSMKIAAKVVFDRLLFSYAAMVPKLLSRNAEKSVTLKARRPIFQHCSYYMIRRRLEKSYMTI